MLHSLTTSARPVWAAEPAAGPALGPQGRSKEREHNEGDIAQPSPRPLGAPGRAAAGAGAPRVQRKEVHPLRGRCRSPLQKPPTSPAQKEGSLAFGIS